MTAAKEQSAQLYAGPSTAQSCSEVPFAAFSSLDVRDGHTETYMDELQQQADQIYTRWQAVYDVLRKSPATAWQPHLPNANLEMVNEAVTTLRNFLVKADAPKGFRPTYELGKTVASSGMSPLMGALQQLEAGTYTQLPNFVSNIVAMLGAAHTMAIFSDRKIRDRTRVV